MRKETGAVEECAADPDIQPRSPWRVVHVSPLRGYRLSVTFRDGLEGVVDMVDLIRSPNAGVFAALLEFQQFTRVGLQYGAPTWPGEIDIAPDAIHRAISQSVNTMCELTDHSAPTPA